MDRIDYAYWWNIFSVTLSTIASTLSIQLGFVRQ